MGHLPLARNVVVSSWKRPGWSGAILYGVAAAVVGGLVTVMSRLQVANARGSARVVKALPDGPVIVISNHVSAADGVLLAMVCRRLGRPARMLAKAEIFKVPLFGRALRRIGFIPVRRGTEQAADALDAAAEALAAGELVALFPEGRRTRDPNRWPERAKTGAVRLALRTGAPIVPVAMEGAHRVLGKRNIVVNLFTNVILRPKVVTRVGDPIDVRSLLEGPETPDEVRRVTDIVMARLIDLLEALRGEQSPAVTDK